MCFFNLALMIGMIYCQHFPAGRYAIILYKVGKCTSPAIQMHVSKCLSLLFDVAIRRITFVNHSTRNKNATHLLASASEEKNRVRTPERQTTAVSIYYQVECIQVTPRSDMDCFL